MTVRLPRKLAKLDRSVAYLLHRAEQHATDSFQKELSALGLTRPQFTLLLTISLNPKLSQKELSSLTGLDQSTLGNIAGRLEEHGLLTRPRKPGSPRGVMLALTRKGKNSLEKARTQAANVDRSLLHAIPHDERRIVLNALMTWSLKLDEETL